MIIGEFLGEYGSFGMVWDLGILLVLFGVGMDRFRVVVGIC